MTNDDGCKPEGAPERSPKADCFAEASDADKFMKWFGGETFDPKQRGRGSNWARWKK
jgi:hypothetical protein